MSFEAYKIAVKLSLVSNVGTGLVALAGQFRSLNKDVGNTQSSVNALERQLLNIKRLGLIGGAMAGAGGLGLALFKGPLEEAKLFQTEVARFTALGLGEKANQDAIKFANGMNIMGSSARDNLKLLKEATTITGDLHHAMAITPLLSKMKFGIESVMGEGHGTAFDKMFQDAIKVTELRGALVNRQTGEIDTNKFASVLNMMTKAYVASGGMVKPGDYLAAMKTGGVSTKLMNDEMFFYGLGHFMQESGGSRTGTASMSMFQNWAMGRMPQRVAERMAGLGLLDRSGLHYGKTGHLTGVDPMALKNSKDFTDNPFKYVNDVIIPVLQKKGFTGNDLNIQLASLLGIRTAANLADQMVREQKVADLYIQRAGKADGIGGLYDAGSKTLQGNIIGFHSAWRDLMKEIGISILPAATKALVGLTGLLKSTISLAREFPVLTKGLVISFGVLSGLVAAGGVIMLTTAAFKALGLAMAFNAIGGSAGILGLAAAFVGPLGLIAALVALGLVAKHVVDNAKIKSTNEEMNPGYHRPTITGGSIRTARGEEAREDAKRRYGMVKPGSSQKTVQVQSNIHIDGKKVAEVVTTHQAKEAARPQSGVGHFDPNMMVRPVGAPGY